MKKAHFILPLIFLTSIVFAQEGYEVIKSEQFGQKISILYNGEVIHEIVPKHQDKVGEGSLVVLLYDKLVERGSLDKQPELFDDVTGDGNPDILVLERPDSFTNAPTHYMAIRLFSIIDGKVQEFEPYFEDIGEIIYFNDFNNDGVLEIVLTDMERYFLYSRDGIPISKHVLIFDKHYKSYWSATKMME